MHAHGLTAWGYVRFEQADKLSSENLFKLAHKKGKAELHGNMTLRIQTALEHHACANGGERCEKCTRLFNHWDVHGAWDAPEVQ